MYLISTKDSLGHRSLHAVQREFAGTICTKNSVTTEEKRERGQREG